MATVPVVKKKSPPAKRKSSLKSSNEALAARAEGIDPKLTKEEMQSVRDEADKLAEALDKGTWVFGKAGSKNIPVIAAAGLGNWKLIADLCRTEEKEGLWGLEIGSPGFYFSQVAAAKMVSLRDARKAGDAEAVEAIRHNLRAAWAWDALVALPVGRLTDRVLIADKELSSKTPELQGGLTVPVAGNRWTTKGGRGKVITSDDAHSMLLAWALDWKPRESRGPKGELRGPLPYLINTGDYNSSTSPEPWGLTERDRATLLGVIGGDVASAREACSWIPGSKPTRPERDIPPWEFRLRRTEEGCETVFYGPYPNPNKPARAASQITVKGEWIGLQPSPGGRHVKPGEGKPAKGKPKVVKPAAGYHVWTPGDGRIYAESDTSKGAHSIPELGGTIVWQVDIIGDKVTFK